MISVPVQYSTLYRILFYITQIQAFVRRVTKRICSCGSQTFCKSQNQNKFGDKDHYNYLIDLEDGGTFLTTVNVADAWKWFINLFLYFSLDNLYK